jgi:L-rhamnose mutarotase
VQELLGGTTTVHCEPTNWFSALSFSLFLSDMRTARGALRLASIARHAAPRVACPSRGLAAAAEQWQPQAYTGGGGTTASGLTRVGFTLQFETQELEQYLKDHEAVWPEMQQALVDCGWHNYSLFYRPDGFAFGYFETDADFDTCCARMAETEVNPRWQDAMSKYTPANVRPDEAAGTMDHYFYLGTDRVMDAAEVDPSLLPSASWDPPAYTGGGGTTGAGLRRCCFQMKFEAAELEQYLVDHETVWPEMQQALVDCGWHNYSLFYRPDGFAVGYFETDAASFEEAGARMDGYDVNAVWQEAMSKYTPANTSPIDAAQELTHYFYIGDDRIM